MSQPLTNTPLHNRGPANEVEDNQATTESLSQDDTEYGTRSSEATRATTIASAPNGNHAQDGGLAQNHGPGAANGAGIFPPGDPLTTAAIGAQFADQLQEVPPAPTLEERNQQREARMARLHEAFEELNIHVGRAILERLENENYNMAVPESVASQFAALWSRESPMGRWASAEDAWSAIITYHRPESPETGMLWGWDELEPLPFVSERRWLE